MELLTLIFMTALVFFMGFTTLFFRHRYRKALMSVAQLIVVQEKLADRLDRVTLENSKEVNEGFIKFLSDSRQSAFDYIEHVQEAIQNYLTALENNDDVAMQAYRMELFNYLPEAAEPGDKNQGQ